MGWKSVTTDIKVVCGSEQYDGSPDLLVTFEMFSAVEAVFSYEISQTYVIV